MASCHFVWIYLVSSLFAGGCCLRSVRAGVPLAVREGDTAVLSCLYDLEGEQLYSVKWYRGIEEIYTYLPREVPSIKVFHRMGSRHSLHIEKSQSNATHLVMSNVTTSLSGRYSCEVSADAPFFRTALVSGEMHVVVVPEGLPEVSDVKPRYKVGDTLRATCLSRGSRPAANLTWFINGQILSSDYVRQYRVLRIPDTKLETSHSVISIELSNEHFKMGGRIKVRCTASVYNVYWQTSETSAEEERPKASVVASQDYRLNEVKRPTESPIEVVSPESGSTASVVRWTLPKDILPILLYFPLLYLVYLNAI